jgi:Skp family chaperone for outer membrane proteins
MKRHSSLGMRVILLTGSILGLLASSGFAQQLKIAYVDVQRLKAEYKEYVLAQEEFNKLMIVWQATADSMQNEMNELIQKVQNPPLTMREDAVNQLREELLVKQNEYQFFANEVMGPDGEAAKKEYELSKPLRDKIDAVIRLIALKENYTYVLDSAAGSVLYAKDELDITNKVLAELNK